MKQLFYLYYMKQLFFLKEYTFEYDGIQHENLRIYVYNEEKFYEITVQSIGYFAYNQRKIRKLAKIIVITHKM